MVILRCPSCTGKFKVASIHEVRFCPLCGYDTAPNRAIEEQRFANMLEKQQPPHYQKPIKNTVDNLYRDHERTSEFNMHTAAEAAGCDVSEMASMKLTNMRDNLRQGDDAAISVNNEVTKVMQQAPATTGFTRDPQIAAYRQGTQLGPAAGAGLGALTGIQKSLFGRTPERIG